MKNKVTAAIILLVSGAAISSCSSEKVLNENRAMTLIQEAMQKQPYMFQMTAIVELMSQSDKDWKAGSVMDVERLGGRAALVLRRLIDAGFIEQTIVSISLPVISGTFHGKDMCAGRKNTDDIRAHVDFLLKNESQRCVSFGLTLSLQPVHDSNRLTGSSVRDGAQAYGGSRLEAEVTPDDYLTFSHLDGPQGSKAQFMYLEDGDRAFLANFGDYLYVGTASKRRAETTTFRYSFLPSLQGALPLVPAGQLKVASVSNLQLTTETRATANYVWTLSLDEFGQAALPDISTPSGNSVAEFAKKPDGSWTLISQIKHF